MFKTSKLLIFVFSVVLIECYGQSDDAVPITLNVVRDTPVNMAVGPENAVYCRLLNPQMFTVFEGFGRCQLVINRMDFTYAGLYSMYSGTTGSMDLDFAVLHVRMTEPEKRAIVTCTVEYDSSNAIINCSLPESGNNVRACTFRNPRGNDILITGAQITTNSDVGTSISSELVDSRCAITINNIKDPGQGIWRCSLRTDTDIFYGFQTVYVASAVEDSSSIRLIPTIRPNRTLITGMEGEPVALLCSIDAPIRYCYFRDDYSGQVINVSPDLKSSSAEYIGYGFEAGDCGLKLSGLQTSINLAWSCNIGVVGHTSEYTQTLDVYVYESLKVSQSRGFDGKSMRVSAFALIFERVELCRFVRSDGLTFSTAENSISHYNAYITQDGGCYFTVNEPSELDLQPWVVAMTTVDNNFEMSKRTIGLVEVPRSGASGFEIFIYVMLSAVLVSMIVGIALGVMKCRR